MAKKPKQEQKGKEIIKFMIGILIGFPVGWFACQLIKWVVICWD